jgi:dihydropyrimidine dehydrogenase (NAD+) subunit PreT
MSQVHGVIGYFSEKEVEPGVWENQYTEKKFKGENLKIKRKIVENNKVTTDVVYEQFSEFKASKKELQDAQKLGVTIIDGCVPVSVKGKKVKFEHREVQTKVEVKADLIVLAVGQRPDVEGLGVELVKGEVNTGKDYFTKDPKVFVAGDIAHSKYDKSVVGCVRTGKEVALYVDKALGGK